MIRKSAKRLAVELGEPLTEAEMDELLAGVRAALVATNRGWSPESLVKLMRLAKRDLDQVGEGMGSAVAHALEPLFVLAMCLRIFRALAKDRLIWPPNINTVAADPSRLVKGPDRVQ